MGNSSDGGNGRGGGWFGRSRKKTIEAGGRRFDADEVWEMWARLEALSRSQAVIEFTPEGEVLKANSNFLSVMGYPLEDIQGRHHRMFVEPSHVQSPDYAQFWKDLRNGEFRAGLFKRIGSGGREVWIQASYNPVLDSSGRVLKIVKYTTDVTAEQERTAHAAAKLQAIDRSQGVIEFDLDIIERARKVIGPTVVDGAVTFAEIMTDKLFGSLVTLGAGMPDLSCGIPANSCPMFAATCDAFTFGFKT